MRSSLARRGFLAGLTGLLVAPSIVRAASIMPVRVPPPLTGLRIGDVIRINGAPFLVTAIESGITAAGNLDLHFQNMLGNPAGRCSVSLR